MESIRDRLNEWMHDEYGAVLISSKVVLVDIDAVPAGSTNVCTKPGPIDYSKVPRTSGYWELAEEAE